MANHDAGMDWCADSLLWEERSTANIQEEVVASGDNLLAFDEAFGGFGGLMERAEGLDGVLGEDSGELCFLPLQTDGKTVALSSGKRRRGGGGGGGGAASIAAGPQAAPSEEHREHRELRHLVDAVRQGGRLEPRPAHITDAMLASAQGRYTTNGLILTPRSIPSVVCNRALMCRITRLPRYHRHPWPQVGVPLLPGGAEAQAADRIRQVAELGWEVGGTGLRSAALRGACSRPNHWHTCRP